MTTLPALSSGRYSTIATIDPGDAIVEYDETNNTVISTTQFGTGVDLAVHDFDVPQFLPTSGRFDVGVVFESIGATFAGTASIDIYVSDDPVLDPTDVRTGGGTVTFSNTTSVQQKLTVVVPSSVPTAFNVIVRVSAPVTDIDPSNDVARSLRSVSTLPNFGAIRVAAPPTVAAGSTFSVEGLFVSEGAGHTGTVSWAMYLSLDPRLDPSDPLVDNGATMTGGAAFTIRGTVPLSPSQLGPVYVILEVDSDGTITEFDENDNTVASDPVRIDRPDIVASNFGVPPSAFPGETITVRGRVENRASVPSTPFRYAIVFDDPGTPTSSVLFLSDPLDLQPSSGRTIQHDVVVPSGATALQHLMWLIADYEAAVDESSEANNTATDTIDVHAPVPDLAGSIIDAEVEIAQGATFNAAVIIENAGAADATNAELTFYLSAAATPRPSDREIGTRRIDIGAVQQATIAQMLTMPMDVPLGEYFLTGILDPRGRIDEVDETNNALLGVRIAVVERGLEFVTNALPDAVVGMDYDTQIQTTGGPSARFTLVGGTLPAGIGFNATSGVLSGKPAVAGVYTFVIEVFLGNATAIATFELVVRPALEALSIPPQIVRIGTVGERYCGSSDFVLRAVGGSPPYSWRTTGQGAPGLSVGSDGTMCGTPTAAGRFQLPVAVVDQTGAEARAELGVTVNAAGDGLRISDDTLADATVGVEYTAQLTAEGGDEPYQWSVVDGALPAGLRLDDDQIVGTSTTAGLVAFTLRVTDDAGATADAALSIRVRSGTTQLPTLDRVEPTCGCQVTRDPQYASPWGLLFLLGLARRRRR